VARKRTYAVVYDLEFTAWEGSMQSRWSRPREYPEVIQIGAVKVDAESPKIVDEFEILVRPRVNPELSEYLVALTGITNEALREKGVDFVTAFRAFVEFAGGARTFAFGRDDLVLRQNLKLYGFGEAEVPPYTNANPWFMENGIDLTGKHACDTGELAGVPFVGKKHTALADARSVAAGIAALIARGAPNLFLRQDP
jgi:inhibitor of KinA sporulation pathway (predicted exonuclease)